jgi:hypothetical protein
MRRNLKGSFVASLSPQIAAQEIEKLAWASRGWNLQEYALSKGSYFSQDRMPSNVAGKNCDVKISALVSQFASKEDLKWNLLGFSISVL